VKGYKRHILGNSVSFEKLQANTKILSPHLAIVIIVLGYLCILFGEGLTMEDAKWYFTHESEEDRLWYRIFFAMCRKFGVSWSKASEEQKAFIEEITRINYEREEAKHSMTEKTVRGFFDTEVSV